MKKLIIGILVMILGVSLLGGMETAYAVQPTHTPNPAVTANRLAKAKSAARKLVTKRENDLKKVREHLKKFKGTTLESDYAEMEGLLNKMQEMLTAWKTAINAATTVDDVKSVSKTAVQKTRYYLVFRPDFMLLIKVMVMNRSYAQIQKRIQTYETELSGKFNNSKNTAYEDAVKKLAEIKEKASGIPGSLATLKSSIYALTPDLANSNRSEFNKKLTEVRTNVNTTKAKINTIFANLKQLKALLDKIRNNTPTPAAST